MGPSDKPNNNKYRRALWFGLIGGVVGVLLDADHGLRFIFPQQFGYRPFHWPAFYIACGIILYYCSCFGRLLYKKILKKGGGIVERPIEEIIEEIKELIARIEKRLDRIEGKVANKADKDHIHPRYIPLSERTF